MFDLKKNRNFIYSLIASFAILASFLFTQNEVKKINNAFQTTEIGLLQQVSILNQNNQAIFYGVDHQLFSINLGSQKDFGKQIFSLKWLGFTKSFSDVSFKRNIQLQISNSLQIVGKSSFLKIIYPFHDFW